jgi:hypothetical protein
MKSLLDTILLVKENPSFVDNRRERRLVDFTPIDKFELLSLELAEGADASQHSPIEWNEENVLEQLKSDLDFAIEKAEGQRGISVALMKEVVDMWLFALEITAEKPQQGDAYYLNYFEAIKKSI